jgi:FixJ family two-component response regulator
MSPDDKGRAARRYRLALSQNRADGRISAAHAAANQPRTGAISIAVVDDEASVRKALVRLFDSADLHAEPFPSARAFLRALEERSFDCLVLDLQMPDMTGLDLQRYLRMVCPSLYLPVIIVTAHDEPGTRDLCFAAGVRAYMRKPVDGNALLDTVHKLTAREAENGAFG